MLRLLPATPRFAAASPTTQVTQFLVSGGLATLIHWAVMGLLIREGLQPVVATTMGALAGSVFNYVVQFYWTFNGNGVHGRAMPTYACTVILAWCVNAGLFYFLTLLFHTGLVVGQACTTATVAVMNFILYKRIVFHERIT